MPRISICIPNYNMAAYVGEAIASGLNQTEPDLEVVVVDNASTDGSWDIIRDYANRDPRVRPYRHEELVRMPANWNRCVRRATGDTLVLLSADDILRPGFAAACLALFDRRPDLGYVWAERSHLNEQGCVTDIPPFYTAGGFIPGAEEARINLIGGHTAPSQMLVRTSCLHDIGGYDERFDWAFDIHAKLNLCLRWDVGYVQAPLCLYRVHQGASTSRMTLRKLGVMEIYRVKCDILDHLPPEHAGLTRYADVMIRKLARLCLTYCSEVCASSHFAVGREYLHLAESFWPEIGADATFAALSLQCCKTPAATASPPAPAAPAGPPYPLPEGAVAFVPNLI